MSFRAFLNFGIWRRWHEFLTISPFGGITDFYPRLYEKPFRPYLHKGLKSYQRCARWCSTISSCAGMHPQI